MKFCSKTRLHVALALGLMAGCGGGGETKIDPLTTGIELSVVHPSDMALDQLRVGINNGPDLVYGPVFVPQTPRPLDTTETLVVLVGPERDGQTLTITVGGYDNGAGRADGTTDVLIKAHTVAPTATALVAPPTAACGDGQCLGSENYCSCPTDCAVACGDGCCTPPSERKQNCATDCR